MYASKTSQRFKKKAQAFTLIEILAAILILSFITLGIASTMKSMTKLDRKVKTREYTTLTAEIALDRMQRELQMAYNDGLIGSPTSFKAAEVGTGLDLTFSFLDSPTKTLIQTRTPGVVIVNYHLEKSTKGSRLVRSSVPFYAFDKLKDAPQETLANGVLDWKMEFYDYKNDKWDKEWDSNGRATTNYFPKAVRLTLECVDTDLPESQWKDKSLRFQTEFFVLNEMEK